MKIIIICLIVCFVCYIIFEINKTKIKGKKGEIKVSRILNKLNGYVFNNYIINDKEGKTHQIDHIFVNNSGVFVIETKNYAGRIYGKDNQLKWKSVLAYGKTKNDFYNPVKQNNTHIYHISKLLNKNIPIFNIVVFVQNNTKYIESEYTIDLIDLKYKILDYPKTLNNEQVNEIIEILNKNKALEIKNKEHVKNIKKVLNNIDNNICPRCGATLIQRNGKNGMFYGCSNYPRCKFTKKL